MSIARLLILGVLFLPLFLRGQGSGVCQKTTDPGVFTPGNEDCWKWVNVTDGGHFTYNGTSWSEVVGGNATDELQTISLDSNNFSWTATLSDGGGSFTWPRGKATGYDLSTYGVSNSGTTTLNCESYSRHIFEVDCTTLTTSCTINISNAWDTGSGTAAIYTVRFHSVSGSGGTINLDSGKTFYDQSGAVISSIVLVPDTDVILTMYTSNGSTFYTMR